MHTFTIDLRALKAAAVAASADETRYYLKGVHIEHTPSGPVFVATDGARLIAARHDWRDDETATPAFAPVIVPLSLIKRVKLNARGPHDATLTLTYDAKRPNGAPRVALAHDGATYMEGAIEGAFPKWRAILPRQAATGETAQYDGAALATFSEAAKLIHGKGAAAPLLAHNGPIAPAVVDMFANDGDIQAFGLIMPLRDKRDAPLTCAPDWTAYSAAAAAAA